ncbi:MAG TPA: MBL fold metallo-hydrolase [Chitinophaga sp.]|nr:MBL fold metallo-hydrolase [Chitinophaga sp.]
MNIKQFEDKPLSHYSYALLNEALAEIILIDPSRNIQPYLTYAGAHNAKIIAVIETHPHADFVSGHQELQQQTGAAIYCSAKTGASYQHIPFDEGAIIQNGDISLRALNTPGHSPDSISIVASYQGKDKAVFTGDTLFIGDCGRPDLRENAGNHKAEKLELAGMMYHSLRNKLMLLNDDVIIYPAHGAGTLCGKALSEAGHATMGEEKKTNWSLQPMDVNAFTEILLTDQPFIPQYFPYDVEVNRRGAPSIVESLRLVQVIPGGLTSPDHIVVDTRPAADFKAGHLPRSFNIMLEGKFETWLGSLLEPDEPFYLLAENKEKLLEAMERTCKIGYEPFIKGGIIHAEGNRTQPLFDEAYFRKHQEEYTIVDVRNSEEVRNKPIFSNAVNIPLPELRKRIAEIPADKPLAVHCAGGYRSAAASSILEDALQAKVFDIGEKIKNF